MLLTELWYPRFQLASDHSLLVTFGAAISRQHHRDVLRLFLLLQQEAIEGLRNLHPAYSSLLISFDPLIIPPQEFEAAVRSLVDRIDSVATPEPQRIQIPVCYDPEFGPDLFDVAAHTKLSPNEVVRLHSSVEYLVYFVGFSPGFPYLGEMPEQLAMPRLPSPRIAVPAGSVAIGGHQTGIYPLASPGGWRIIGRTPLRLFRPDDASPTLLRMGDVVIFQPISRQEFEAFTTT